MKNRFCAPASSNTSPHIQIQGLQTHIWTGTRDQKICSAYFLTFQLIGSPWKYHSAAPLLWSSKTVKWSWHCALVFNCREMDVHPGNPSFFQSLQRTLVNNWPYVTNPKTSMKGSLSFPPSPSLISSNANYSAPQTWNDFVYTDTQDLCSKLIF